MINVVGFTVPWFNNFSHTKYSKFSKRYSPPWELKKLIYRYLINHLFPLFLCFSYDSLPFLSQCNFCRGPFYCVIYLFFLWRLSSFSYGFKFVEIPVFDVDFDNDTAWSTEFFQLTDTLRRRRRKRWPACSLQTSRQELALRKKRQYWPLSLLHGC